jgi:hypothetical protein
MPPPAWSVNSRLKENTVAQRGLLSELWGFMRERKKFWLLPIFLVLISVGALFVFAQGSVLAPLIYTMF